MTHGVLLLMLQLLQQLLAAARLTAALGPCPAAELDSAYREKLREQDSVKWQPQVCGALSDYTPQGKEPLSQPMCEACDIPALQQAGWLVWSVQVRYFLTAQRKQPHLQVRPTAAPPKQSGVLSQASIRAHCMRNNSNPHVTFPAGSLASSPGGAHAAPCTSSQTSPAGTFNNSSAPPER